MSANKGPNFDIPADMLADIQTGHVDMRADWDQEMQNVDPSNPDQVMDHAMKFIFDQFTKFSNEK